MPGLFELLETRYPSAAACAAALCLSRQAYCQAKKRRRLSESKAMLAGVLIGIPQGDALFINATGKDPAAPILDTTQPTPTHRPENPPANTNYARYNRHKETAHNGRMTINIHSITSKNTNEALNIIKWVLAVAKLPADSPRFCYYVSRWRVPEKISAAIKNGTFPEAIANCPPIDPAWVRLVPAALTAYEDFIKPHKPSQSTKPSLLKENAKQYNVLKTA